MTRLEWFKAVDLHARMSLRADAQKLALGYLWWALEPIFFVAVFYLVFGVILQSGRADFLTFLIVGKLPFQWFAGAVNQSANSIVSARPVVGQLSMNLSFFPLSKVQEGSYKQMAVFVLLFTYVAIVAAPPSLWWLLVIPIAICQYFLIAAVSMVCSVFVCIARDYAKIIQLGVMALMFASGIFWDVRALPDDARDFMLMVNPIAYLLDAYRQVLLYQEPFNYAGLWIWTMISIVVVYFINKLIRNYRAELVLRVLE